MCTGQAKAGGLTRVGTANGRGAHPTRLCSEAFGHLDKCHNRIGVEINGSR